MSRNTSLRTVATLGCATALAVFGNAATHAGGVDDRVQWIFEFDSAISGSFVAVGDDGTIYSGDNQRLYALNPDGSVKWTHTGAAGGKPIDFLPDGTIVTARSNAVIAITPQGDTAWEFTWEGSGQQPLAAGPSVGPDGNIYAVSETDGDVGLGAFSLTPQGDLLWADEGDPVFDNINATNNRRMYFTDSRVFFQFGFTQAGGAFTFGYDFEGDQTNWFEDICTGTPRTDQLNRVILATSCGIVAVDPIPEEVLWTTSVGNVTLRHAIGESGTIYSGAWGGALAALDPDGNIVWQSPNVSAQQLFTVAEASGELLFSGLQFGAPNTIGAVSISDGSPAWEFVLRTVNGHNESAWSSEAGFSPDSSIAYVTTRFSSNGAPGALYAIHIGDAPQCDPADLNCDGVVNGADLAILLGAWGPCANCDAPDDCPADLNGDCEVNGADLAILLGNWG